MDLLEESLLGPQADQHWYYVSKAKAVMAIMDNSAFEAILDIGAGSGIFSKSFIKSGYAQHAVCVDPHYPEDSQINYLGKSIEFVRKAPQKNYDLALFMDVLEHVDDDSGLLCEYLPALRSGTPVLITVPAFSFLWSGHDDFLGHKRRYTLEGLEETVIKAGLRPVKTQYFFASVLPLVVFIRLLSKLWVRITRSQAKSDMGPCPEPLNTALIRIHDLERQTLFRWNRFAGLSIFCLAIKP